jgi:hypothetical protein
MNQDIVPNSRIQTELLKLEVQQMEQALEEKKAALAKQEKNPAWS